VIKQIHPNNYENERDAFEICSENIGLFDYIFTLNYDLILYWLVLIYNNKHNRQKFRDGMSGSVSNAVNSKNLKKWSCTNNTYNVYFLHGAVHLIEDQQTRDTLKVVRNNALKTLQQLIKALLNDYSNFNNLIVLEGSDKDKKVNIYHNEYLKEGLMRLGRKKGDLVIYGCSLIREDGSLNNDEHVWNTIISNPDIKTIYIGIYTLDENDFTSKSKKIISALTEGRSNPPTINFFTTASNDIWHTVL
jgi:hypothetical protein